MLLVVTAGCGGMSGDRTPTRDPYDVSSTTSSSPTPTPPPFPSTSETPTRTPQPVVRVIESREQSLEAVGNFTMRLSVNITELRSSPRVQTFEVDFEGGRSWMRVEYPGINRTTVERYAAGGRLYVKYVRPSGGVAYRTIWTPDDRIPADVSRRLIVGAVPASLSGYDFDRNGTARFDGEVMRRYVARGPDSVRETPTSVNVTSLKATVLVDDRGLPRKLSLSMKSRSDTGDRSVRRIRMELTDIGNTTVRRPEWVANATRSGNETGPAVGSRVPAGQ